MTTAIAHLNTRDRLEIVAAVLAEATVSALTLVSPFLIIALV